LGRLRNAIVGAWALASLLEAGGVSAQAAPVGSPVVSVQPADTTAQARALFSRGVELVQAAQWGEALSAFERSAALVPHPLTTFNVGACQRALGRYTLSQRSLKSALSQSNSEPALPPSYASDAQAFIAEIDGLLAHVVLSVQPEGATLLVDGRPLLAEGKGYVAGVLPPSRGALVQPGRVEVLLDPGAHVFSLTLKGYSDVVVNRSFAPGSRTELPLVLQRLPATLSVASSVEGASVRLGREKLGVAPISVERPAGPYRVVVEKDGFTPYGSDVRLNPGETTTLRAKLTPEQVPLTRRWWFWTAAVGLVAGAAVATFAATRPEPEPPAYDGGSTGWVVMPLRR
jgi:hypothetical protein